MFLQIDFSGRKQIYLERKESVERQGKIAIYSGIADIYLLINTNIDGPPEEEVRGRIKLKRTEPYIGHRREFILAMPPWTEKKPVKKERTIWKMDTKDCERFAQLRGGVLFAHEYYIEKGYSLDEFIKNHWTYYKKMLNELATSYLGGIAGKIYSRTLLIEQFYALSR